MPTVEWAMWAAVASAVAALATVWMAVTNRRLRTQAAKRAVIQRFLRGWHDITTHDLSISLNNAVTVFEDAPNVLAALARFNKSAFDWRPNTSTKEGEEILRELLRAMCKDARMLHVYNVGYFELDALHPTDITPFIHGGGAKWE